MVNAMAYLQRQGLLMLSLPREKLEERKYKGKLQPMAVYAYTLDARIQRWKKIKKTGDTLYYVRNKNRRNHEKNISNTIVPLRF